MAQTTASSPTATITFLFTDIEGSTERWEKHKEAMARALERHDACLRAAIESHGGTVFKTIGDAFQCAFPDPVAALHAAADAQCALAAADWSACGDGFPPMRVRMALHAGPAAADARGDFRTPLLNRVARLESAGHGGQILTTLVIQQLVRDVLPPALRLRDLGVHRLKDLRYAEHIFQVVADGMPDVTTPLRTMTELAARDRIVVVDPEAAGGAEGGELAALTGGTTIAARTPAETLAALRAVVLGEDRTVVLTAEQVRAAARHRPTDLAEYRLARIAEWSQPRYRLDGRFVALTLLVDQGEESVAGRWAARQERYDDLGKLLAGVPDPAVVVLGPPGSGKSTLLRHLELDVAIDALRAGSGSPSPSRFGGGGRGPRRAAVWPGGATRGVGADPPITFFIQLNQYKPEAAGSTPPLPGDWLAARWRAAYPDLPALEDLLAEGRVVLLLDALNEMPASGEREFQERVGWWKDWLVRLSKEQPGNRVVFSCRTLDYSAPLSTPALRVPQVQIEALSDGQVRAFLRLYSPARGEEIWAAIAGTPQLDALRAPYFLALLVDQVEATGELAEDRAGLFTAFVRQALRREAERGSPMFSGADAHGGDAPLLASRDLRRLAQWRWGGPYELPERGALVPKLSGLAYGMQDGAADGGASQVRLDYDAALAIIDHPADEAIVRAGVAISVLDEDPAADEVLYRHQLVQEYFAARVMARDPQPALVASPWRAAEIRPGVRELLDTLPPAETLPPLPQTGWEETTILAAAMSGEPEAFLRALMPHNLEVAGRAARLPAVRARLSEGFLDELRWALVARSRDPEADLRARIAAGLALGHLGDLRFERRVGPYGEYLMPPMVEIAGGRYPIGEDEAIWDPQTEEWDRAHIPRHEVEIAAMAMGQFPVTNAEWACFMAAGGYEDKRWWDTEAARAWRRGEGTAEGSKRGARGGLRLLRATPRLLEEWHDSGQIDDEVYERWQRRLAMTEGEFEAHLAELYPGGRETEPRVWGDERYNNPSQPIVGVSWYEARAYASWLSAQSGQVFRLPSEVEWEAAARGGGGRLYAYGAAFDATKGNVLVTRLKRTTPVGVFVEGDTPEGASDMGGNVGQWTTSACGVDDDLVPAYAYPYDASDGREDVHAGSDVPRVVRGGSWYFSVISARAAFRYRFVPDYRVNLVGFRVVRSAPIF